jgi:predicted extracellular nuclease
MMPWPLARAADDGAGVAGRTVRGGVLAAPPGDALPGIVLADGAARIPPASVGDRFPGEIVGTIDYAFGGYRLRVDALPALVQGSYEPAMVAPAVTRETLAVATFNVQNLSARERPAKLARLAESIMVGLGGPDLLVIQEMQDDSGAGDDGIVSGARSAQALADAISTAGGPAYAYREIAPLNNEDGGEPGANIRVGFLYRQDRGLAFVERPGGDAATPVSIVTGASDDGASDIGAGDIGGVRLSASPGRIAPDSPAWTASRKPLVGEFTFNGHRLLVVGCHFASKRGDGPQFGRFQPPPRPSEARRIEQARLVRAFAAQALTADPAAHVIVLGDLNDVPGSATLAALTAPEQPGALSDLVDLLPEGERYSYIFGGQSEAIDHLLVSPSLRAATQLVEAVHSNAGTASTYGPPTDHDPLVAHFRLPPPR